MDQSEKGPKKHLVTAALPYANGPLHIGHIAGAYLPSDTYVRYLRLKGEEVAFVCGSDEHGAAITLRAKKEGTTPRAIVDRYHSMNKQAFADFGIDFDIYHRTSDPVHHETSQAFFKVLNDKGVFTKETTEQYFDEEHQQFLADRYITGTCPNCNYDSAYGDQCENCGKSLSPKDLIGAKSTLSGATPVMRTTSHWYLPMQDHSDWLRDWISTGQLDGKQHHDVKDWKKSVRGQCLSWIDAGDGLQPRAMTRDLDWGVPVPVEGAEGKVLYVWLDAPIGYISATKEWAGNNGKDWKDYWQNDACEMVHFIGKDNIVFHCIIFPILLKAHGNFNLPVNVPANEFLNLEGRKISTSKDYAVWLHEYMEAFPTRIDELRYVLTSIAPETKDSEFTWKDYQARVNNELVAILGNFVNRVMVLCKKYYEGVVPEVDAERGFLPEDKQLLSNLPFFRDAVGGHLAKFEFRQAQAKAIEMARIGNKYLADSEPWKLAKTDPERVKAILYTSLIVTRDLALLIRPFLPNTSSVMEQLLNIKFSDTCWAELPPEIPAGHQLGEPQLLFQKVEDAEIEVQIEKLAASLQKNQVAANNHRPVKPEITFDDFTKLDIRVGTILTAEKVEKADKLLKLTVDTGVDTRTVVSGIAQHFSPEEVIGKRVSVLLNLAPRKIRGVESQGMILMAEDAEGKLEFVSPDAAGSGAEIR